ncbi:N-acetylmuramic acid 6-phosphate etherase [Kaistia sp. 32K]|uniref:N-acetylmuramic acid 6-phosphate etherase n=1 Tax=Kaistia sp. 32K TaxID=2795690 RepID=UPI0019381E51|nr:N-acetylmuramic acid 6-phosphate etherase [Kaistia sp. 32K]BCP54492.1 N-acetylmuramic acid 6-phosphate etherase [Kaistia sp. 32K]
MTNASPSTEIADPRYRGLDTWKDEDVLAALQGGHARAVASVEAAIPMLAKAARLAAEKLADGGRLIYVASGSPALIALGDALEIPQTYGVADDRIVTILAGGLDLVHNFSGLQEDDPEQARIDVARFGVGPQDCVVAVSASGSTPYTVEGLRAAIAGGAASIAIASNPNAPLFEGADVAIHLDSGPEVIAGSTRMGAGTAQKAALNMLSTLIAIHLGHVYDGLMVNVRADNGKLRARAARIIANVAGVDEASARVALEATNGEVKPAILIAAGAENPAAANELLNENNGNVRTALAAIARSGVR